MPANGRQPVATHSPHPKTSGKGTAHTRRKYRKHRRMRKASPTKPNTINKASNAEANDQRSQMWQTAFASAILWQAEYRTEYWKQLAARRQLDNQRLRERLRELEAGVQDGAVSDAEDTDDEKTGDGDSSVEEPDEDGHEEYPAASDEYLKFLEVSVRHQMQLKRDREEQQGSV